MNPQRLCRRRAIGRYTDVRDEIRCIRERCGGFDECAVYPEARYARRVDRDLQVVARARGDRDTTISRRISAAYRVDRLPLPGVHVILVAEEDLVVVSRRHLGVGEFQARPDDRVRDVRGRLDVALPLNLPIRSPCHLCPGGLVCVEVRKDDHLVTIGAVRLDQDAALGVERNVIGRSISS